GAAIGTAISFTGYSDLLHIEHPGTFDFLEDVTAPVATVATMIRGDSRIARIDDGSLPVTSYNGKINFSEDHASAYLGSQPLSLSVLSPGNRTTSIFATVSAGPGAPRLSSLRVRLSS